MFQAPKERKKEPVTRSQSKPSRFSRLAPIVTTIAMGIGVLAFSRSAKAQEFFTPPRVHVPKPHAEQVQKKDTTHAAKIQQKDTAALSTTPPPIRRLYFLDQLQEPSLLYMNRSFENGVRTCPPLAPFGTPLSTNSEPNPALSTGSPSSTNDDTLSQILRSMPAGHSYAPYQPILISLGCPMSFVVNDATGGFVQRSKQLKDTSAVKGVHLRGLFYLNTALGLVEARELHFDNSAAYAQIRAVVSATPGTGNIPSERGSRFIRIPYNRLHRITIDSTDYQLEVRANRVGDTLSLVIYNMKSPNLDGTPEIVLPLSYNPLSRALEPILPPNPKSLLQGNLELAEVMGIVPEVHVRPNHIRFFIPKVQSNTVGL